MVLVFVAFSISAQAQLGTDELCSIVPELESLTTEEFDALADWLDESAHDSFANAPLISDALRDLPDDTFRNGMLVGMAECYLYGKGVDRDIPRAMKLLEIPAATGYSNAQHILASTRLFNTDDSELQQLGIATLQTEYEEGSAYAAGKLGWAYNQGIGVAIDIPHAVELYNYAAERGMTYWQFLLAHAYEMGYLGLELSKEKSQYWRNYQPRIHIGVYECWVANYYKNGIYPENPKLLEQFELDCSKSNNALH